MACEKCNGMFMQVTIDPAGNRSAGPCECVEAGRIGRYMAAAKIPAGFGTVELENFETGHQSCTMSQRLAKLAVEKFSKKSVAEMQSKGMILFGKCGVGKTHLAVSLLKTIIQTQRRRGFFCSSSNLLEMIRMSFERDDVSEWELMAPVLNTDVVLLDDLGSGKITEYVQEKLAYILSERYNRKLTTIITTNYPVLAPRPENVKAITGKTLGDCIGERAFSRLHEMCLVVKVEGDDFRIRVKKAIQEIV